jgi:mannose/cellobiose epimerase-like protein (N-acyl-D-glucosamine 2-epimerase family)
MLGVLRRHVMETWFPRCLDRDAGGFNCDFDRRWTRHGPQLRMLEFQARQTRMAARLALAFPREPQWVDAALHGFRYLRDAMWDRQHGGWFWMLGQDGQARADDTKHGHGIAYAVQACALVYEATGEPSALDLARDAFHWFDQHAHDDVYGGYRTWLRRDGSVITRGGAATHDPLGHDVGLKDVNTHGDWIEGLSEYLAITHDPHVQARLQELVGLFLSNFVTGEGALHYGCDAAWHPQPGIQRFGYALQAAHRLLQAAPFLAESSRARDSAERVFLHTIRRTWAGDQGGFWFAGPAGPPDELEGVSLLVRRRVWWLQFEGLRSLVLYAVRDGEHCAPYAALARRQWALVRDRMLDHVFGGTYATCPDDLPFRARPFGRWGLGMALNKGNVWKDGSHETDSLVTCIRLLRAQPTGALSLDLS